MSWFDATGLANIAKTALKEAQKTIDKALDIRDDDDDVTENVKPKLVSNEESSPCKESKINQNALVEFSSGNKTDKDVLDDDKMPTSNWGSFSGSFFQVDNSKKSNDKSPLISTQPQKLSLLLSNENEKVAPLATPEKELTPVEKTSQNNGNTKIDSRSDKSGSHGSDNKKWIKECGEKENLVNTNEIQTTLGELLGTISIDDKVITRSRGRKNSGNRNSYIANRLSVHSTESEGKKSSESVEVLTSLSCTTSPDTDLPSISASSSLNLPVSPSCTDSVEVIDSLASPSSIEVLVEGTGSGRTTQSSSVNSPKDGNSPNQNPKTLKMVSSPLYSPNDISPESFEVIPDLPECDEELSRADSYTSASESTGPTILEPSYQYSYCTAESLNDLSQASSKFRSGDSTPDVISKLPLTTRNSCDVLSESTHELTNFDSKKLNLNKSAEMTKSLIESDKLHQKFKTLEKSFENSNESQNWKNQSLQNSPTKKIILDADDAKLNLKVDDMKYQKSESSKNEVVKTHNVRKDLEEGDSSLQGSDVFNTDEICGSASSYSDTRTIVANDSSCDEIIFDSSLEDLRNASGSQENTNYRNSDKLESDVNQNNSSFYVKNLLSEAMKEMSTTRETSPTLSEKSRSDLVKVGSEQTSGQTSGDELETTTSSDIEIISRYSPNGDSSSTTSRHSPAKLLHLNSKSKLSLVAVDILGKATQTKTKGHQREPSEGSSFCSEDNFSEVEKLSKRVTELTEILEARESRLNDLRKTNLEMQEKNQELKKEMEQAKRVVSSGLQAQQSESEKDELIRELKEEGEKLSKKELKQANLIKTLRAHEKSQQALIDNNKIQIQTLTKTVEDLKAELSSKKEAEKGLNESLKQMNKKITRQDEDIANLLGQMEKAVVKAEELKILLNSKETELAKCKELLAAEDYKLRDAQTIADSKAKQLERLIEFQESAEIKLENLSQQLKKAEEMHSEREKHYREEKNELMRRLQEAESRNEELSQSVSKATRPLLRQMEALQATITHERETWEKQERNFLQKLEEAESKLSSVMYNEKSFKQETIELRSKASALEEKLQASSKEITAWKLQVESLTKQLEETKNTFECKKSEWEKQEDVYKTQINTLKVEVKDLEQHLINEKANADIERKKISVQEQLKEKDSNFAIKESNSPRSSPALSFGRASLSESVSSNIWPQFGDDGFETTSISGKYSTVYENLRSGNTTSLIENLQAQLKMRDGEISQLMWESQRRDAERLALTTELSSLTSKLEEQESKLAEAESSSKDLKELQTKYNALLEMYGEKVEEVDELRLDLQDVKEMYKSQIDHLLQKENQNVSPSS